MEYDENTGKYIAEGNWTNYILDKDIDKSLVFEKVRFFLLDKLNNNELFYYFKEKIFIPLNVITASDIIIIPAKYLLNNILPLE